MRAIKIFEQVGKITACQIFFCDSTNTEQKYFSITTIKINIKFAKNKKI